MSELRLTHDTLKACLPYASEANLNRFLGPLNQTITKYGIDTPARLSCFLPQIAHESGCLKYVLEIASGETYEGRRDLGNIQLGDGVKFKGRGLIQITGRNNYTTLSEEFGVRFTDHPAKLEEPLYAALSAGWYWKWRDLNLIADKPDDWLKEWKGRRFNRFEWITVKINGGLNGLSDRLKYYDIAKKTFAL